MLIDSGNVQKQTNVSCVNAFKKLASNQRLGTALYIDTYCCLQKYCRKNQVLFKQADTKCSYLINVTHGNELNSEPILRLIVNRRKKHKHAVEILVRTL